MRVMVDPFAACPARWPGLIVPWARRDKIFICGPAPARPEPGRSWCTPRPRSRGVRSARRGRAASGPAASSTPPMLAAAAALVISLRMKPSPSRSARPAPAGADPQCQQRAGSLHRQEKPPGNGQLTAARRRRPSAQREDTGNPRPARRRPVTAAASSGTRKEAGRVLQRTSSQPAVRPARRWSADRVRSRTMSVVS